MTQPPERYSYGPWHEGPDPLAPPVDLTEAVDGLGDDVMSGASPAAALRELLRRGTADTAGLDELTRRVWQRRDRIQRDNRLDGTLSEVRRLLDEALRAERGALFPDPSDEARLAEAELDVLPNSPAAAVRELANYQWRSQQGQRNYQRIRDLLGEQLLESRFEGMKDTLRRSGPEDLERIRRMLDDLGALLAAHAKGFGDIERRFAEFMRRHGDFFPENPRTVDELVDVLAARAAAAQRALNSMTQQQRDELAELSQQAFGDQRLAAQLSTLDSQLRALRPDADWDSARGFSGDDPLGLGQGADAMSELAELDALAEQLSQDYPGASLADIDLEAVEALLGSESGVDARRLAELDRRLREQGLLRRASDGSLRLSPKALRRLGESALADVTRALSGRAGQRDTARAGSAGELSGATRRWQFGDTQPWDVSRTMRNAVLRHAEHNVTGRAPSSTGFDVSDVEVAETEHRSRAAVALCVDVSWSMVAEDRWLPMKRTALALHQLISTRFRGDALQLITFGRYSRAVELGELVAMEGTWEQGTNLHHALLLAGRHLREHSDARPVVLLVTDGEPTAHLAASGDAEFDYPPSPHTIATTLSELDRLSRLDTAVTVFRLGEDPPLVAFIDQLARRCGGRVVAPEPDGLGAAVVGDYLRRRPW